MEGGVQANKGKLIKSMKINWMKENRINRIQCVDLTKKNQAVDQTDIIL